MTAVQARIIVVAMRALVRLASAIATNIVPKATAETPASTIGRELPGPAISGPQARMTPTIASAIPAACGRVSRSPRTSPRTSGTSTLSAATGATTPIVPVASAV